MLIWAAALFLCGVPITAQASSLEFFRVRGRILVGDSLLGVPLSDPVGDGTYRYEIDWRWNSDLPPDPTSPDTWFSSQGLSNLTVLDIKGLPLLAQVTDWYVQIAKPCETVNGVPRTDCIFLNFTVPLYGAPPGVVASVPVSLELDYLTGYLFPAQRLPSYLGMRDFDAGAISAGNLFGRVSLVETVPEPATLTLLGVGLLGVVVVRRRLAIHRPPES
jgi:hypothetical protein